MPNWCKNTLTISGPASQVNRFIEENRGDLDEGEYLLFSKSVPEQTHEYYEGHPYHLANGQPGWHYWRTANWGTRAEPEIIDFYTSEVNSQSIKTATYKFQTPWSPANFWCQNVIEKYPELKFCLIYGDGGADFSGTVVGANGKVISLSEGSASEYLVKDFG